MQPSTVRLAFRSPLATVSGLSIAKRVWPNWIRQRAFTPPIVGSTPTTLTIMPVTEG